MASTSDPAALAKKPAVFLLDAMSFIFRAYHAMQRQRPMSTRNGLPTAAIYVFVNMINKLRRDFEPEYFAAVFDVSAPVFRDERARGLTSIRKWNSKTRAFEQVDYAGYKANRTEMPGDLAQQLPYIRRSLEALRIPILQAEGFEADDVIGTLAREAAEEGHPVFVVSNDKDMLQLVTERVKVLNPAKDNLVLDREKVIETLGVPPEKVIDVMALRGDSIDNIPGAPGIGDKGSVELIQQFGSVEAALEHASEVKRKTYRESLEHNRDTVLLSKELVTIDCGVPLPLDLEGMRTQPYDLAAARQLFSELEFTSMLKELGPGEESEAAELEILSPPSDAEARRFFELARGAGFALAMDTTPLDAAAEAAAEPESGVEDPPQPMTGLLDFSATANTPVEAPIPQPAALRIAVSAEAGKALVFSPAAELRELLEDASVPKALHDLKATLRGLGAATAANQRDRNQETAAAGPSKNPDDLVDPGDGPLAGPVDDLMLYSYLINPTHATHRLPDVVARFASRPLRADGARHLPEAAHAVRELAPTLRAEVESLGCGKVYREIDLPLVPVLLRMEEAGVQIDHQALAEMSERLGREIFRVGEAVFACCGHRFNINSPKQLGDVLFNKMNLPKPLKYGKGKVVSTAVDVLEELAEHHEAPRLVLEYRQLAKLKSTYVDSLPLLADRDARIHTTFNQVGTATGRLSSVNPNLQNIPIRTELGRQIRAAFIASPGRVLLSADYSQIELRLLAHFSQDRLLVRAYSTGEDIHTLTASEVFGIAAAKMDKQTRDRAKAVNFGIVYGISPFGLSQQLGIVQSEAKSYIETYFARYSGVREYIDRMLEQTRQEQMVRTLFGRVRPIPDIQSRNANLRGFAERTAINTPLQGTAADLIKVAMIRIDHLLRERKLKTRMTLQVHDELVFEVPEDEIEMVTPLVRHEMEHVIELSVPIVADCGVGKNWRDLE
ncbi:MAG TPA: DNA polymerase I [Acidobacteriaceae bacterium]|nr:DNA polymerase I [Acidobacteriaceae bacterium]